MLHRCARNALDVVDEGKLFRVLVLLTRLIDLLVCEDDRRPTLPIRQERSVHDDLAAETSVKDSRLAAGSERNGD